MKLNKKQKRTATIASMAALLAVVLGMGGQTFAKYITTNTGAAQTATVAKWGYVINQNAENLFGQYYGDDVTDNYVKVGTSSATTVVGASSTVVAPGTTGELVITVTGEAEVKSQLSFVVGNYKDGDFSATEDIKEIHLKNTYSPITWTLTEKTTTLKTGSLADIETYLEDAANFPATPAGTNVNLQYKLTWAWPFSTSNVNDANDTKLGDLMAGEAVYDEKYGTGQYDVDFPASQTVMSFAIEVSVAQVQ